MPTRTAVGLPWCSRLRLRQFVAVAVIGLVSDSPAAITLGQADTFQDGTTVNWQEGAVSPNPPQNISSGGPAGAGDAYLKNISSGGAGAGSRMVMFNTTQWAGNYAAAGVDRITAQMNNLGSTSLRMRVAIRGGSDSSWFVSAAATFLPAGSSWMATSFDMNASSLVQVAGATPLSQVITNVMELRILSATTPDFIGDAVVADLGVDNISAKRIVPFSTNSSIHWFKVAGGGGASTGAEFAVRGTIGQLDAGKLGNGSSTIQSGFWGLLAAVQTPGAPTLNIKFTTTNTVQVYWPSPSSDFVLQQNANLNTTNWIAPAETINDNGTIKFIIVNSPVDNRFYRLSKTP
jgi:hypothetical protein